jgi:hypothetical protein
MAMSQIEVSGQSGLTDYESIEVDAESIAATNGAGADAQAISGNGFTYRANWGLKNNQWKLRLTSTVFTANTRVFVSISEGHVGAARYTVHNVVPENGAVTIWVNIEWSSPIQLYADYMIVNP